MQPPSGLAPIRSDADQVWRRSGLTPIRSDADQLYRRSASNGRPEVTARDAQSRPECAMMAGMPRYDLRCRSCGDTFEITRSMADLDEPAPCPSGHTDTVRLLRTIAVTGVSSGGPSRQPSAASAPAGGGCCGGGCCG
jgi:putative FmdB family regulatory protein